MKRLRLRIAAVIALVVAGSLMPSASSGAQSSTQAQRQDQLIDQVAGANGIPRERLQLLDFVSQDFASAATHIDAAKVVDRATGIVYAAGLDGNDNPATFENMLAADQAANFKANGKVEAKLNRAIKASPGATFATAIWVTETAAATVTRTNATGASVTAEQSAASLNASLAAQAARNAPNRSSVADAVRSMGGQATEATYGPVVFASLTRQQIDKLAKRSDVDHIYGSEQNTTFEDDATTTHRAFPVYLSGNFGKGTTVKPVIHEDDGVADFNPYLNNANHPVVFFCAAVSSQCPNGKNIGNHASEVAGVIAANAGSTSSALRDRGMAPEAPLLLSANSQNLNSDAQNVAAFEWARGNGGDPTNMSWGTNCFSGQTFSGRYADWAVRNLAATQVISAGNRFPGCAEPTDSEISSPGNAWSVITVGAFDDFDTGFQNGDAMASFSRFATPAFAGAPNLKPELAAVGVDVRTTDAAGGDHLTGDPGVDGTSFSAPNVAGIVSLMLARQPGQSGWPETNKSGVLVSATRDIDTSGTDTDGLGSPNAYVADQTYRLGRYVNDCNASCQPLGDADFPRTYSSLISGVAGTVRVATSWDSQSTGGAGTDVLGADLDLTVRRVSDNVAMCSSASFNNAAEACTFTAVLGESYTVVVNRFSSVSGWAGTFLGTAWSLGQTVSPCTSATALTSTVGTQTINGVNTVFGNSYFDDYPGNLLGSQIGKERVFTLTLPTTRDVAFSDTNSNLDMHLIQQTSCLSQPWTPTSVAHGINSITVDNLPAGTYYLVIDGFNGAVGTTNLTKTISGP